jgi:chorismate synthase
MNNFGRIVKINFSGESHGDFLTVSLEGLPKNLRLDEGLIRSELEKRRPDGVLTTGRIEPDEYRIVSGLTNGRTDGTPLVFVVANVCRRPEDYQTFAFIPRPGHADYPAWVKNPDFYTKTGGGMYSGRLTVLFVIAGAVAKQLLNAEGIRVVSHISRIGSVTDDRFDPMGIPKELADRLESQKRPVINPQKAEAMEAAVLEAKSSSDSLGGTIETMITGLLPGIGEPWFDSIESLLSHLLFSIPAVKGVEFGDGFAFSEAKGSAVRDEYAFSETGSVVTTANHNGGLLGGLATGMPVIVRTAIKPASSIGIPQKSVHLQTREPITLTISGRHDPCIPLRAVHVVNAAVYVGLLDLVMESKNRVPR